MSKHVFIINPVAGKAKGLKLIPLIKDLFNESTEEYVIEVTNSPGHAERIAAAYSRVAKCRIYSVGGDGTLNEVINGIAGTDSELAIIPCGTGNDFIKSIVGNPNVNDILVNSIIGTSKPIDFAKVNSRYFINIASVGFDAEVAYNMHKFKKLPGVSGILAYILSILFTVFKYSGDHLKINIDGKKISSRFLLAAIANGRYYGGGMQPVPHADISDGFLDICLIEPLNIIKIIAFFPRLIKGTHVSMKEVSFYKGKKIEIESDREISINTDGEIFKGKKTVFTMQKVHLSIVIPKAVSLETVNSVNGLN